MEVAKDRGGDHPWTMAAACVTITSHGADTRFVVSFPLLSTMSYYFGSEKAYKFDLSFLNLITYIIKF
jgi:hypothetical protein